MLISDPQEGFLYPTLTLMIDSYILQLLFPEDPENLYQNSEHLYQNVQIAGGKQLQKTEL